MSFRDDVETCKAEGMEAEPCGTKPVVAMACHVEEGDDNEAFGVCRWHADHAAEEDLRIVEWLEPDYKGMSQWIFDDVMKAMQPADELGGVESRAEYIRLMERIMAAVGSRLEAAKAIGKADTE